jgi:hypothetical protein
MAERAAGTHMRHARLIKNEVRRVELYGDEKRPPPVKNRSKGKTTFEPGKSLIQVKLLARFKKKAAQKWRPK